VLRLRGLSQRQNSKGNEPSSQNHTTKIPFDW
jgi:hypothetical protein